MKSFNAVLKIGSTVRLEVGYCGHDFTAIEDALENRVDVSLDDIPWLIDALKDVLRRSDTFRPYA